MKTIVAIVALLVSVVGGATAADGRYLNVAILSLPDRYLADVPLANRVALLVQLSEWAFKDDRLDYTHGWLHWYSDGPSQDSPGGTSMFWMKLLPLESGTPLVFVHMAKPFATGGAPRKDQTFVLERAGNEWKDVTSSVMPKEVDVTMHFRPRRSNNVIEVAAWKRFERRDGYDFGERKLDLIWGDGGFRVSEPDSPKLSSDYTIKASK